MNQHTYQAARLKLFEHPKLHEVWAYPKDGSPPFHRPVRKLASEEDFQTKELEKFQEKTETAAARAFRNNGRLTESERNAIVEWIALHIVRTRKSRSQIFASPEAYNREFYDEFTKEVFITRKFQFYRPVIAKPGSFFITSDEPIVEVCGLLKDDELIRFFAASPQVMISLGLQEAAHGRSLSVEDYFNAMMWANAHEFVYSHRDDVSVSKLQAIATEYEMFPTEKSITFEGRATVQDIEHMDTLHLREGGNCVSLKRSAR